MFDFFGLMKKSSLQTVLVIDDEPNIVQTLKNRLQLNEFEVLTASNGKEGLEIALDRKPDVILLDVIMPIMDGHQMLEKLRANADGKDIPVIMLTARSQPDDVDRAMIHGIEDYITKPFDLSELLEKIEKTLQHTSVNSY